MFQKTPFPARCLAIPNTNGHEYITSCLFLLYSLMFCWRVRIEYYQNMNEGLKSHFLNLYSMVMADGEVSTKEKMELYRIGEEFYEVTPEEFNRLLLSDEILFYIPQTEEEKILYLYDFALIAWADGKVADEEVQVLKRFALRFGVRKEEVEPLVDLLLYKAKEHISHEELMKEFSE